MPLRIFQIYLKFLQTCCNVQTSVCATHLGHVRPFTWDKVLLYNLLWPCLNPQAYENRDHKSHATLSYNPLNTTLPMLEAVLTCLCTHGLLQGGLAMCSQRS